MSVIIMLLDLKEPVTMLNSGLFRREGFLADPGDILEFRYGKMHFCSLKCIKCQAFRGEGGGGSLFHGEKC